MTTVVNGSDVGTVNESWFQAADSKGTASRYVSFAKVTIDTPAHRPGAQKETSVPALGSLAAVAAAVAQADLLSRGLDPEPVTPVVGSVPCDCSQFVGISDAEHDFRLAHILHPKVRCVARNTTWPLAIPIVHCRQFIAIA